MIRLSKYIYLSLLFFSANALAGSDIYSCPSFEGKQALGIDLYSGPPSEMAELKPNNGDEINDSAAFWSMYEDSYWGVCFYDLSRKITYEFKLSSRVYSICKNIGSGKIWDKFQCE